MVTWTYPDSYDSQYYSYFDLPDGTRAYTLTGVAVCTVGGLGLPSDGRWRREQLYVIVSIPDLPDFPPQNAVLLRHWAPFFTLNSISNDGVANDAGWAVDSWEVKQPGDVPAAGPLTDPVRVVGYAVNLAAGDIDGYILRVGYHINLVGQIV
jgi:hypothetical protein